MKLFEYMNRDKMLQLDDTQQRFVAKMIVKEVKKAAAEHDITEEEAYYWMSKGMYGGDRELNF